MFDYQCASCGGVLIWLLQSLLSVVSITSISNATKMNERVVVKVQDSRSSKGTTIHQIFSELCGEMFVVPFCISRFSPLTWSILVPDATYTGTGQIKHVVPLVNSVSWSLQTWQVLNARANCVSTTYLS